MPDPIIIDTPDGIAFAQLCARKGALKLENMGLKRRGMSAYAICKQEYGLKGNREKVLAAMEQMIEDILAARREEQA